MQLQLLLGYDEDITVFTGIVELIGDIFCPRPRGYNVMTANGLAHMHLVEPCLQVRK